MLRPAHKPFVSVEDYLTQEDGFDVRHEYIDGALYAMTGASDRHGLITINIATFLRPLLRGTACQLFANDMKVRLRLNEQDAFYSPDLALSCDPADRETYHRSRPCLLVEVLSESTARIDRREKLWAYQPRPSLQACLLVEQDRRAVELHRRARGWGQESFTDSAALLDCLDIELPLDVIYEDVPM